jgi:hypothetical protein
MKFDPNGRILMTIGRKPESINVRNYEPPAPPAAPAGRGGAPAAEGRAGGAGGRGGAPAAPPVVGAGVAGESFNRPTDVGWDAQGNIRLRRLRQLARRSTTRTACSSRWPVTAATTA